MASNHGNESTNENFVVVGISIEALMAIGSIAGIQKSFAVKGKSKQRAMTINKLEGTHEERPFYLIDVKKKK